MLEERCGIVLEQSRHVSSGQSAAQPRHIALSLSLSLSLSLAVLSSAATRNEVPTSRCYEWRAPGINRIGPSLRHGISLGPQNSCGSRSGPIRTSDLPSIIESRVIACRFSITRRDRGGLGDSKRFKKRRGVARRTGCSCISIDLRIKRRREATRGQEEEEGGEIITGWIAAILSLRRRRRRIRL